MVPATVMRSDGRNVHHEQAAHLRAKAQRSKLKEQDGVYRVPTLC